MFEIKEAEVAVPFGVSFRPIASADLTNGATVVVVVVVIEVVDSAVGRTLDPIADWIRFFTARRIPRRGMSGMIISLPFPPIGIMLSGMGSLALNWATTLSPRLMTSRPKRWLG